jgi:tetratricopeptide (TPR) repeat protein
MGNLEEALKDHCRAIKMDPENEEYSGAEACLYSSMIMFKKGNEKWAKQFFARAVKLDPTLILKDELWEFAKAGFFPALEYLYKSAKEARK